MKNSRSLFVNWTRPRTLRCSTVNCCLSAAFSASSWLLDLKSEETRFKNRKISPTIVADVKRFSHQIKRTKFSAHTPTVLCRLPLQRLAFRAGTEPDGTRAAIARTYQLGSARLTVAGRRSVSCRPFLDQQVSRLKQELEMDDGFHRTPLVRGRLKALQYVFPLAVGA